VVLVCQRLRCLSASSQQNSLLLAGGAQGFGSVDYDDCIPASSIQPHQQPPGIMVKRRFVTRLLHNYDVHRDILDII